MAIEKERLTFRDFEPFIPNVKQRSPKWYHMKMMVRSPNSAIKPESYKPVLKTA